MRSALATQTSNPKVKAPSPAKLSGSPNGASEELIPGSESKAFASPPLHPGLSFATISLFSAGELLPLQRKLAIGKTNDPLERQADLAADHVMSLSEAAPTIASPSPVTLRRQCACKSSGTPCESCSSEEDLLQKKSSSGLTPSVAPPLVHAALRQSGQPLDASTRAYMEPRFRYDFSRVRVHADPLAAKSASSVNARAYTVGNNVVFGAGQFSPHTVDGRKLLAHELAHVMQQSQRPASIQRQPTPPAKDAERDAAVADAEATLRVTSKDIEEQSDEEDRLKLDPKKSRSKQYAWKIAGIDKKQIEKRGLSPQLQRDIQVKLRFFEGEGRAAYLRTLESTLSQYPDETSEILKPLGFRESDQGGKLATEQNGAQPSCDIGKKQFLLQYEGEPEKSTCINLDDPVLKDLFDLRITRAVGFATGGATWENVSFDKFKVIQVFYNNGSSEVFYLNDVGDFHYGKTTAVYREFSYYKRKNGLVYPISQNQLTLNEVLTPNLISYKNGLRYQVKEMQDLYVLLQTAGAFAQIIALNSVTEDLKASILSLHATTGSDRPGGGRRRSKPGGGISTGDEESGGVPKHVDDVPTAKVINRKVSQQYGIYTVLSDKEIRGDSYEITIYTISRPDGPTTDITAVGALADSFVAEGKASGASQLKITGRYVGNKNVLRINRMAQEYGGKATALNADTVEITIPLK